MTCMYTSNTNITQYSMLRVYAKYIYVKSAQLVLVCDVFIIIIVRHYRMCWSLRRHTCVICRIAPTIRFNITICRMYMYTHAHRQTTYSLLSFIHSSDPRKRQQETNRTLKQYIRTYIYTYIYMYKQHSLNASILIIRIIPPPIKSQVIRYDMKIVKIRAQRTVAPSTARPRHRYTVIIVVYFFVYNHYSNIISFHVHRSLTHSLTTNLHKAPTTPEVVFVHSSFARACTWPLFSSAPSATMPMQSLSLHSA